MADSLLLHSAWARVWRRVALVALGAACATPLRAETAALDAAAARQWLARIHAAAHARNYRGILVFSADGVLSSSRVAHFGDGGHSYERVETLDGTAQVSYRVDDRVYAMWPQRKLAVIEDREPRQGSLRQVIEPRAQEHYALSLQGIDRVAGREAQVLLLQPRDEQRYAQRIWVDTRSSLMLRADVLDAKHQVLESSAFSEVEIDIKPAVASVLQPVSHLQGWRIVRPPQANTKLADEGWVMNPDVPGFTLSSCSRRLLGIPAPDNAPGDQPALQAVFSDGLTHVSVFVEAIGDDRSRHALLTRMGAMNTLMAPFDDRWWVTVMGDVPAPTLKRFFDALQRRP